MLQPLGRLTPPDFEHIAARPLSAIQVITFKPVTIGINWYTTFDAPKPMRFGSTVSYHLPDVEKGESLGSIRGGHAVCLPHMGGVKLITEAWQRFYDQGSEGSCEGFAHAKAQSLETGKLFDAWFLYDQARKLEGTFPNGEGTTNRAIAQVLQTLGAPTQEGQTICTRGAKDGAAQKVSGVRWTVDVQEVLAALGRPNAQAVPLSNNWGLQYPLIVWLPVATLDRLLKEEGEADVVTDA